MCCSASGSMVSRSQAWWPAPPRCCWSTGACRGLQHQQIKSWRQNKSLRVLTRRLRRATKSQRFAFFAFFFLDFLATFFATFLAAFLLFLADFFVDFFADFLAAFLAFLAFFGITFFATFLAAFLTFLATVLTASLVASAALPIASVVCSRMGLSSSIASPRVY